MVYLYSKIDLIPAQTGNRFFDMCLCNKRNSSVDHLHSKRKDMLIKHISYKIISIPIGIEIIKIIGII